MNKFKVVCDKCGFEEIVRGADWAHYARRMHENRFNKDLEHDTYGMIKQEFRSKMHQTRTIELGGIK